MNSLFMFKGKVVLNQINLRITVNNTICRYIPYICTSICFNTIQKYPLVHVKTFVTEKFKVKSNDGFKTVHTSNDLLSTNKLFSVYSRVNSIETVNFSKCNFQLSNIINNTSFNENKLDQDLTANNDEKLVSNSKTKSLIHLRDLSQQEYFKILIYCLPNESIKLSFKLELIHLNDGCDISSLNIELLIKLFKATLLTKTHNTIKIYLLDLIIRRKIYDTTEVCLSNEEQIEAFNNICKYTLNSPSSTFVFRKLLNIFEYITIVKKTVPNVRSYCCIVYICNYLRDFKKTEIYYKRLASLLENFTHDECVKEYNILFNCDTNKSTNDYVQHIDISKDKEVKALILARAYSFGLKAIMLFKCDLKNIITYINSIIYICMVGSCGYFMTHKSQEMIKLLYFVLHDSFYYALLFKQQKLILKLYRIFSFINIHPSKYCHEVFISFFLIDKKNVSSICNHLNHVLNTINGTRNSPIKYYNVDVINNFIDSSKYPNNKKIIVDYMYSTYMSALALDDKEKR